MNQLKKRNILFVLVIFLATSCSTPVQELIYLNEIESNTTYQNGPLPDEYKIRANDQLYIKVISDNPVDVAFLNLISPTATTTSANTNSMELITYLVNEDGNIEYPYLGTLKVIDLTVPEVRNIIQEKVDKYMTGAAVFVKQVNRTITVLGEVKSAGQKEMIKNKLTIFEALGTAGDVTDWGNRQSVKLIRETTDDKYIAELDLTDPDLINSPYYYVLPHDVIYVEHRTRVYGAKNLSYTTPITISISVITLGLLILNLLK
ncbi:polysaccharide biosynthesis/export family protein [Draconibacterium sp.]|nr:polysaccharide biosynthesis/export family protein [Draconibacterium sp.]